MYSSFGVIGHGVSHLVVPAMGWEAAWASGLEVTKCLSDTSDLTVVSCFHELEDLWLDMSLARVPSDMGIFTVLVNCGKTIYPPCLITTAVSL